MAKKVYAGVNNIAQEASKMYIGVNGVARKVNKAYVGVNNVAREVFNGTPSIEVLDLPTAKTAHAACNVGDYVLIAGGVGDTSVVTYNSSLTRGTAPSLTETNPAYMCATQVERGGYAIFRGANSTAYNGSLTKTAINLPYSLEDTSRNTGAGGLAGGSFGGAVIVGNPDSYYGTTKPEAYSASLTVRIGSYAHTGGNKYVAGVGIGGYVLMAGGQSRSGSSKYSSLKAYGGDGYPESSNPTSLDYQVINHVGIFNGSYAIFAGGDDGSTVLTLCNAYAGDLVKWWSPPLPVARTRFRIGTAIAGKGLICGGKMSDGTSSDRIDVIDRSLTLSTAPNLIDSRYDLVACTIGDYVLVTGGTRVKPQGELTTEKVEVYDKNLNKIK